MIFLNRLQLKATGYGHGSTAPRTPQRRAIASGSQAVTPHRGSQGAKSPPHLPYPAQSFTKANSTPQEPWSLHQCQDHSRRRLFSQHRSTRNMTNQYYGHHCHQDTYYAINGLGTRQKEPRVPVSRALLGMQTRATRAACRGPAILPRTQEPKKAIWNHPQVPTKHLLHHLN